MKSNCRTFVLLALLAALAACGDIDGPTTPDTQADASSLAKQRADSRLNPEWLGSGLPPEAIPATADQLVASFRAAYDQRDPELLDLLLSPDYRFIKQDEEAWDRTADVSIMTKMMVGRSGQQGISIAAMTVEWFQPLGVWSQVPPNDPFFGDHGDALYRAYDVRISHVVAGQNLMLLVDGLVIVYVVPTGDKYQLLGLVDATNGRTETRSWTAVRSLFE
jgi:predicted small lipoprotein YifL